MELVIILVVVALVAGHHLGHAHANIRHGRARGLAPSVYWRSGCAGRGCR